MSNKQFIFCVETKKQADTDWLYIKKLINHIKDNNHPFDKYVPLYMEGKNNYNTAKVTSKLRKMFKEFDGESIVIVCIDLDDYNANPITKKYVESVENYCSINDYYFVYFSRNVEEAFLNRKVEDAHKIKESVRFSKNGVIDEMLIKRLSKDVRNKCSSNIYKILSNIINW